MTIITDGGTTFSVKDGQVTITRSDQPVAVIPLADLQEFVHLSDDDDFEDEAE